MDIEFIRIRSAMKKMQRELETRVKQLERLCEKLESAVKGEPARSAGHGPSRAPI